MVVEHACLYSSGMNWAWKERIISDRFELDIYEQISDRIVDETNGQTMIKLKVNGIDYQWSNSRWKEWMDKDGIKSKSTQ